MRRRIALVLAGVGIFLVGALTATIVIWQLNERGLIFNVRVEPSPLFKATQAGHYDEAMKLALAEIHDDHQDYFQYHPVVYICLVRAYKDEAHRQQWVDEGVSYLERVVSLGPDDPINLLEAAHGYEKAGDLSKNGCPAYASGKKLCEKVDSLLANKDSISAFDFKAPIGDFQRENQGLQSRFTKKIEAWCAGTGH
jgi:hypothetical protein